MANFKHGFDSMNRSVNPDSLMFDAAMLRSESLLTLVTLFDDERLNVGHLYTTAQLANKDLKWFIWDLVSIIEGEFDYESPQAKYANLIGLLALRIIEFNVDTSKRIKDMVLVNPQPFSVIKVDYECDSIVTKILKLRAKF